MAKSKKNKPSYLYSVISITLVLFMLGLMGLIFSHANSLTRHFKENLEFSMILEEGVTEEQRVALEKYLYTQPFVKSAKYVSKDEAAKDFSDSFDEDFLEILGENPLFDAINIYMKANYANPDSIAKIEKVLLEKKEVKEVYYQAGLVDIVNANVKRITILLLIISVIFLLIAFTLIDNTIRLAMFSDRFLIKSMQLVGATRGFISWPFIKKSLINGLLSGILAVFLIIACLYFAQRNIPELGRLQNFSNLMIICGVVFIIGLLISYISTRSAVLKYLKAELDELY